MNLGKLQIVRIYVLASKFLICARYASNEVGFFVFVMVVEQDIRNWLTRILMPRRYVGTYC